MLDENEIDARFSQDYVKTRIGRLPSSWEVVRLGDVTDPSAPIRYGVVQIGPDTHGGVPIVPIKHLGRIDKAKLHRASPNIEARFLGSRIRGGDVLISVKGTIGEVGVVPSGFEGNIAREIARIRPNSACDADFLALQLGADHTQRRIEKKVVGSTRLEFSIHAVRDFLIALPPLMEQRKIAQILRTWDKAIEKLEALRAAKELQFRGLQQKLIDQDFKSYGDTLEQYALIQNLEKITSVDDMKVLTVKLHCKGIMANGRNVPVTLSDKGRPYYKRKVGDFLIGRQNFHNGGFGIVPPELDGFIASSAITSLRTDSSRVDVHYLFYFFSRKDYYMRIGHIMDGTGQKELSDKQIRKLPVSIPSLEKQVKVVKILNAANEEISLIDTKIEALARQKRGLMQKLLTGEWRVDPELEGA